jgi:dephospho-CoA kinase
VSVDAPQAGIVRPPRIGLTGGIGSGKSTAAGLFRECGAAVIDADALARELSGPGGAAIVEIRAAFGPSSIRPDGGLDRDAMRAAAFADPAIRRRLEAVLHPKVRSAVERAAQAAQRAPLIVIDVPLLFETMGYRGWIDTAVALDCPVELQVQRAVRRGPQDEAAVRAIVAAQVGRPVRLQLADFVLVNNADIGSLRTAVTALAARLRDDRAARAVN